MADRGNKTEKATPRRLQKARREGRFPNTRHLLSGLQFFLFAMLLAYGAPRWLEELRGVTVALIRRSTSETGLSAPGLVYLVSETLRRSLAPLAAGGALLVAAAFSAQLFATQFGFSFKNLAPNLEKLNPAPRLGGILRENLRSGLQAAILLPLFFYIAYAACRDNIGAILTLPLSRLSAGLGKAAGLLQGFLWKAAGVLLVFGVVSYARERRRYLEGLKMSRQEVVDEHKETEGNPLIQGRIRRLQRDFRRRGMLQRVPLATAVIVNPTHYAVALRYEMDSRTAPVVLAKGKNYLASRIRKIAEEHGVTVVENAPLAQALYRSVEVGQEIPLEFYRAVAEVLAYVYRVLLGRNR
jgi:flagellar biosynthetic protein FlhB